MSNEPLPRDAGPPSRGDIEIAEKIYGAHREEISVKCIGCIAEIIAGYRRETVAAARNQTTENEPCENSI